MKKLVAAVLTGMVNMCLFSQNVVQPPSVNKTDWWGDIDGFLNQQAKITLDLASDALKLNPPALQENLTRKMALLMIDNVLHEEKPSSGRQFSPFTRRGLKMQYGKSVHQR